VKKSSNNLLQGCDRLQDGKKQESKMAAAGAPHRPAEAKNTRLLNGRVN
jgi:hypothetical protein